MVSISKTNKWRLSYAKWLKSIFGQSCLSLVLKREHLILTVNKESLLAVMWFLKSHTNCLYKCLCDLNGTDFYIKKNRIEISYHLLSVKYFDRITIKTNLSLKENLVSVVSVFPAANWFEREVFDLFGVFFKNHPDLRRILTDYGFEGHPIRKDFPLVGYTEVRFDFKKKRVTCDYLDISQEFRSIKTFTKKNWNYLPNFHFSL